MLGKRAGTNKEHMEELYTLGKPVEALLNGSDWVEGEVLRIEQWRGVRTLVHYTKIWLEKQYVVCTAWIVGLGSKVNLRIGFAFLVVGRNKHTLLKKKVHCRLEEGKTHNALLTHIVVVKPGCGKTDSST